MSEASVETVRCAGCGATVRVSIVATGQRCIHCGAAVVVPGEIRARVAAATALVQGVADDAKRVASLQSSLLGAESTALSLVVGLLLVACGGFHGFASIWAVVDKGWDDAPPTRVFAPLAGLAAGIAVTVAAKALQAYARRRLTRVFAAAPPGDGAPHGACHLCGGPLPAAIHPSGAVVDCAYCRAQNVLARRDVERAVAGARRALSEHVGDMHAATKRFRVVTMLTGFGLLGIMPVVMIVADLGAASLLE